MKPKLHTNVLFTRQSGAWSLVSQLTSRIGSLAKFAVLAMMLGPEGVGLVTACFALLAILEVSTDIGLTSALIRHDGSVSERMLGAAWLTSTTRIPFMLIGLFIAMAVLNKTIPFTSYSVLSLTAITISRAAICTGYSILPRLGRFDTIAAFDATFTVVDLVALVTIFCFFRNAEAALVSTALSEGLKCIATWYKFGKNVKINTSLALIKPFSSYAGWHWATNVVIVALNQSDKLVIAYLTSAESLGKYQIALKIAQVAVSDFCTAITTNTFPKLAATWHVSRPDARELQQKKRAVLLKYCIIVATIFAATTPIIGGYMPSKWAGTERYLAIATLPAIGSTLINYEAMCVRAFGGIAYIMKAILLQLAIFPALMFVLWPLWGISGMMWSTFLCTTIPCVYLHVVSRCLLKTVAPIV